MQKVFSRIVRFSSLCLLAITCSTLAYGQRPQPYPDQARGQEAKQLVEDFFRRGFDPTGIKPGDVDQFGIDKFAELLESSVGSPFWPVPQPYEVEDVYKIYPTDSAAIVTARTVVDSLRYFGRVHVDWVWFLRIADNNEWRISSVRRSGGLLKAMQMLRYIDTTSIFPTVIKPEVARDEGAILLCNQQLREQFAGSHGALNELVGLLKGQDSIKYVERTGERISLFNYTMIDWKMASQEVPQEALDEFMANASEEEKQMMEVRLRTAEKQKAEGYRMLNSLARRASVDPELLDDVQKKMRQARVTFLNTDLPWPGAIQLTLAGNVDNAVGFLYSPSGDVPLISPEEYFYLEDLGDGWWIFRAT